MRTGNLPNQPNPANRANFQGQSYSVHSAVLDRRKTSPMITSVPDTALTSEKIALSFGWLIIASTALQSLQERQACSWDRCANANRSREGSCGAGCGAWLQPCRRCRCSTNKFVLCISLPPWRQFPMQTQITTTVPRGQPSWAGREISDVGVPRIRARKGLPRTGFSQYYEIVDRPSRRRLNAALHGWIDGRAPIPRPSILVFIS